MKEFKLGGYYVLLDRTAFYTHDYVVSGDTAKAPAGTVVKVVRVNVRGAQMSRNDGPTLFTFNHDRSKFRPASNKQISQYKKRAEEIK